MVVPLVGVFLVGVPLVGVFLVGVRPPSRFAAAPLRGGAVFLSLWVVSAPAARRQAGEGDVEAVVGYLVRVVVRSRIIRLFGIGT